MSSDCYSLSTYKWKTGIVCQANPGNRLSFYKVELERLKTDPLVWTYRSEILQGNSTIARSQGISFQHGSDMSCGRVQFQYERTHFGRCGSLRGRQSPRDDHAHHGTSCQPWSLSCIGQYGHEGILSNFTIDKTRGTQMLGNGGASSCGSLARRRHASTCQHKNGTRFLPFVDPQSQGTAKYARVMEALLSRVSAHDNSFRKRRFKHWDVACNTWPSTFRNNSLLLQRIRMRLLLMEISKP